MVCENRIIEEKMNYIDFHCHLDYREFDSTRKDIVDECFANGFKRIVTVADPYEDGSVERTMEALEYNENVSCMIAAHPHNADSYAPFVEARILKLMEHQRAIGIGEAGLDFHYNLSTPQNQERVFRRQIAIAREMQLPLTIHSREAEPLVLKIIEEERFDRPVIFHCYTGNIEDAREILKRGYRISISGIVTFKKSEFLREIAAMIPIDSIFTETDSPYLSPVPFRGKTNTPLRVQIVADTVAQLKGIEVLELNDAINKSFEEIFKKI